MSELHLAIQLLFAAAALANPAATWSYHVAVPGDASALLIEATFPPGSAEELSVESGTEPFVREVMIVAESRSTRITPRGTSWFAPDCRNGCRIRYRFALAEAAESLKDSDLAAKYGKVLESPPGAWLLRPLGFALGARIRLRVATAGAARFATGMSPVPGQAGLYESAASDLPKAPYSAFGPLQTQSIRLKDAEVEIAFAQTARRLGSDEIAHWIRTSIVAVEKYFRRFPIPHSLVLVLPGRGDRVHGRTLGGGGATILLWLGPEATADELKKDWVLVHELVHLGFPTVLRRHHWAEEGVATYVEPLARARVGALPATEVWSGLLHGLPKGLPKPGDRGLDQTPTWGRTYWGGALFWFLADVAIRERTSNRKSIDDALRAVVAEGGNIGAEWDFQRILAVGDRATSLSVLKELYAKTATEPMEVDLDAVFGRLGVGSRDEELIFDDAAPLSEIRRSMTAGD